MFTGVVDSGLARSIAGAAVFEAALLTPGELVFANSSHVGIPVMLGMIGCLLDQFMDRTRLAARLRQIEPTTGIAISYAFLK